MIIHKETAINKATAALLIFILSSKAIASTPIKNTMGIKTNISRSLINLYTQK